MNQVIVKIIYQNKVIVKIVFVFILAENNDDCNFLYYIYTASF